MGKNGKMDKFNVEVDTYLSKLAEYKKIDKLMKQYESNIKEYMLKNDMSMYENKIGSVMITHSTTNCLDRSLIENIEQYYNEQPRITMMKSLKPKKN